MHTCDKLLSYKERSGDSWGVIARGVGVSTSTIHGVMKEFRGEKPYGGDNDGVLKKIEDWLILQQQRADEPPPIPFVETSVSKAIWGILEFARVNSEMVSITGYAGREKTRSVEEWALQNESVILIDTFGSCNNQVFFNILARTLKVEGGITAGRIVEAATKKLYGSERFIVVDNAHNLQFKTCDNLRYIHEQAKIGIALVGTPLLLDQMLGQNFLVWEQIYSRFTVRHEVKDITLEDAKKIIQAIAPKTNDSAIRRAFTFSGGSTRELVNQLQRKRADFYKQRKPSSKDDDFRLDDVSTAKPMKHEEILETV